MGQLHLFSNSLCLLSVPTAVPSSCSACSEGSLLGVVVSLLYSALRDATTSPEAPGPRLISAETSSGKFAVCSPFVVVIMRITLKYAICGVKRCSRVCPQEL